MRDEKQAKEQWIHIVQYCNSVCKNPVYILSNKCSLHLHVMFNILTGSQKQKNNKKLYSPLEQKYSLIEQVINLIALDVKAATGPR